MRFSSISFATVLLLSSPAFAADTLHLRNGDKLSGEIVFYTPNQVDIETRYGMFQIPVEDISGVESIDREARQIITEAISRPLQTAQTNNIEKVQEDTQPPEEKEKAEEVKGPEIRGGALSGNANFGAGLRTGNSETSNVNADLNLTAKWEKHRAALKADVNREKDDGNITVDNRSLELTHDYFFATKWFMETSARFEQDDIDRLDLRTIGSLGLGYQPYDREDLSLKYVLGPGILDEEFEDGSGETSLTAQWSFDYHQQFYEDLFRLFHEHDVTAPADDFNAYLFQSESGIRVPIRRGIVASGQVDFDWDNDPAEDTKEDDTIFSARIGYEWN